MKRRSGDGRFLDPTVETSLSDFTSGKSDPFSHVLPAISPADQSEHGPNQQAPLAVEAVFDRIQHDLLLKESGVLARISQGLVPNLFVERVEGEIQLRELHLPPITALQFLCYPLRLYEDSPG